jgi:hypothetical protein
MRTVPLHGKIAAGRVALVSDHRYELVMQYRWNVWEYQRRGRHDGPYAVASVWNRSLSSGQQQSKIRMHNLIMGCPGVDHIDGDGLNNQDTNLRIATQAQNSCNQRPQGGRTSAFKGVSWDRQRQRWYAHITVNGKMRNLGRHRSEIDAAAAYDAAARAAWGEFAHLNFPNAA